MKLLKEDYKFDRAFEYMKDYSLYPLGTEVLLVQVVDDAYLYCIDKIKEINISTYNGIVYSFEEAELQVDYNDLIPYTIKNEDRLKELGYKYTKNNYLFTDYMPVQRSK